MKANNAATIEPADAKMLAETVQLLADETRLKILAHLSHGELCVGSLCERLGMSQPAVSHHLALLRVSQTIEARRDGKNNFYSLAAKGQRAVEGLLVMVGN
jgi:ArsR family transcriptional regulator